MNARAEMHVDAFQTTTLPAACAARTTATPAPAESRPDRSPRPVDAPLAETSAIAPVGPRPSHETSDAESSSGPSPALPRLMDWAVVLALVGLFIVAGGF